MSRNKYWILRLFFVLFTMSVSVVILPCEIINVQGLFGEVTTYTVTEDKEQEIVNIKSVEYEKVQTAKGINILNVWGKSMKRKIDYMILSLTRIV